VEGRDGKLTQPWKPAFDLAFHNRLRVARERL